MWKVWNCDTVRSGKSLQGWQQGTKWIKKPLFQVVKDVFTSCFVFHDKVVQPVYRPIELLKWGSVSRIICFEFFYLLFLTYDFQEHVYGHTNGTTVLHLSRIGVPSFSFARPPIHIAQVFSKFAVTIFKLIN